MERTQFILNSVRQTPGDVLDIGCADPGCNMDSPHWLHRRIVKEAHLTGKEVVGVDIHGPRLKEMSDAGYKVVHVGAGYNLPFKHFSLIIAGEVIEHIPNQLSFLEEMKRFLRPGGRIMLTTPNPFAATHALWFWLSGGREHHGDEHLLWLSPRTLRTLCQRVGLAIEKVHFCSYGFRCRKWWAHGLVLLELWPWMRQTVVYEISRVTQIGDLLYD